MKKLLLLLSFVGCVSGCATPVFVDNGTQSRVFTPCTNDNLCIRDSYNIAWDYTCSWNFPDIPVSYRSKQSEYQSNKVEYILRPESAVIENGRYGRMQ